MIMYTDGSVGRRQTDKYACMNTKINQTMVVDWISENSVLLINFNGCGLSSHQNGCGLKMC